MGLFKRSPAAAMAGILVASTVAAQDLRDVDGPAEFPPDSYEGAQYVDSRGCVFVRAGISGNVTWIPRVNRERTLLCGFEPTFAQAAPALPVIPDPVAPVAGPSLAPTVAEAPAAPPAPVAAAPQPTAPATQTAEPLRLTRAEACAGITGPHPRYMNVATGAPIDCGPAVPAPAARPAAPAPAPAPTPVATTAAPEPMRITRAEACAGITGPHPRYLDVSTGAPVDCGEGPVRTAATTDPVVPDDWPPGGYRDVWSDGRLNPERGLTDATVQQMSFVQIGTFAVPSNAERTANRFSAMGLPVRVTNYDAGGGVTYRVVYSGPFVEASELSAALHRARAEGFEDAFMRQFTS